MKKTLIILILLGLPALSLGQRAGIQFTQTNSMDDIKIDKTFANKPLIFFSSREYLTNFLTENKPSGVYWVLPAENVGENELAEFKRHLEARKFVHAIEMTAEGAGGKIGEMEINIIPKVNMPMIVVDEPVIIIDVDFFFRGFKSEMKTPKMADVLTLFQGIIENDLRPSQVILVKSLDITLPHWAQEYAYGVERAFDSWIKNEFPGDMLALDYADQCLYYFSQNEEAYSILKEIEKRQEKNPFFYKRLFTAALKLYNDGEMLIAAKKAYELDREMIELYMDGAAYLLEKAEIYPAYVLLKEGLKNEPWNQALSNKLKEVVEFGYDYYNHSKENDELFEFFKNEREKMLKGTK